MQSSRLSRCINSYRCTGECVKCTGGISGADRACQAMGQVYHAGCFSCCVCGQKLKGKPFYDFSGQVFCEEDYLYSSVKHFAEVCTSCGYLITDMVLQALGKSFHPDCFRCVICNETLEGQPFSVDTQNKIYCVKDYHSDNNSREPTLFPDVIKVRPETGFAFSCLLPAGGNCIVKVTSLDSTRPPQEHKRTLQRTPGKIINNLKNLLHLDLFSSRSQCKNPFAALRCVSKYRVRKVTLIL